MRRGRASLLASLLLLLLLLLLFACAQAAAPEASAGDARWDARREARVARYLQKELRHGACAFCGGGGEGEDPSGARAKAAFAGASVAGMDLLEVIALSSAVEGGTRYVLRVRLATTARAGLASVLFSVLESDAGAFIGYGFEKVPFLES